MTSLTHNQRRAMRFGHVLTWCKAWDNPQERLVALLADAMHWCDANGEDFHYALCVAGKHFVAELNDEQTEERRLP